MASLSHTTQTQLRTLYRSLLRELPARPLNTPSPLQQRIRAQVEGATTGSAGGDSSSKEEARDLASVAASNSRDYEGRFAETSQFLAYVRAQRQYTALLERYNPGMNMTEEERVRLTMRRVGMELPDVTGLGKKP